MNIVIREADLATDHKLLLDILLRNRDHGDNELRKARFEWSYFNNPYGVPRAWLVIDKLSSRTIGMVAAFPRKFKVNGSTVLAWNGGDTSINKEYRTLGVALKLRRAIKACVDRREMDFLYSYPVDRMRIVLEKIGHKTIGSFIRHGLVMRTDLIVEKFLGRSKANRFLSGVTNILPPMQWSHRFADRSYCVWQQPDNCFGDEYDELYQRASLRYNILTVRDARFLDWRFNQNPLTSKFKIFRLEKNGELQGYAIIGFERKSARIFDILIDGDRFAIRTMLLGLIRRLREMGVYTLALRATATSPILAEAKPLGFVFKDPENSGVALYAADLTYLSLLADEKNWFMTQADRDV